MEANDRRLTMLSMFGYYVQATELGEGPVEGWAARIADPFLPLIVCSALMGPSTRHLLWPCLPPLSKRLFLPGLRSLRTPPLLWFGPDRCKWSGPFSDGSTPDYLRGKLPGVKGGDTAASTNLMTFSTTWITPGHRWCHPDVPEGKT